MPFLPAAAVHADFFTVESRLGKLRCCVSCGTRWRGASIPAPLSSTSSTPPPLPHSVARVRCWVQDLGAARDGVRERARQGHVARLCRLHAAAARRRIQHDPAQRQTRAGMTHPRRRRGYSRARSVWRLTAPGPRRKWSWTCGRLWSSKSCTTYEGTSPSCVWRRKRACARPQLLAQALAALGRPSCCLPATSAVTAICSSWTRGALRLLCAQADGQPVLPLTGCGRACSRGLLNPVCYDLALPGCVLPDHT